MIRPVSITFVVALAVLAASMAGIAHRVGPATADEVGAHLAPMALEAVGSGFTYQGRLTDGAGDPLDGSYDFSFGLFGEAAGGQAIATSAAEDVPVDGGLFAVVVDFGAAAFRGEDRYLEIAVRPGAGGAFETLSPRQALAPVPFALALPGLYTRPNAESPNVVGGHPANHVANDAVGATVGGGGSESDGHWVTADFSTVGGGANNTAAGEHATVGGGYRNAARNASSTVAGGWDNEAAAYGGAIGGGSNNRLAGDRAAIAGGYSNAAAGGFAAVGGGSFNQAAAKWAAIAGGSNVVVTGELGAVGGGELITVTGKWGAVGGGVHNRVAIPGHGTWGAAAATIGGGEGNLVADAHAAIGGGGNNEATGYASVVAGGGGYEHYGSLLPDWPEAGNTAAGTWSTIGGGGKNFADAYAATVSGGFGNEAQGEFATVSGGGPEPSEVADPAGANRATDAYATVGGGAGNYAGGTETFPVDAAFTTVGGGRLNRATWRAATVAGGEGNTAAGMHAAIPGGLRNEANAPQTFAAGTEARADHAGAFVWADAHDHAFASTAENQMSVRSTGGVRLVLGTDMSGNPTWVCSVGLGGSWACSSDRELKRDLVPADGRDVLRRLDGIQVFYWSAGEVEDGSRHLGPTAQDFHAAFGLGSDEAVIETIDLDGVALAAIQGLHAIVGEQEVRMADLEERHEHLEARIAAIEAGSAPASSRTPWGGGAAVLAGLLVLGLAASHPWRAGIRPGGDR